LSSRPSSDALVETESGVSIAELDSDEKRSSSQVMTATAGDVNAPQWGANSDQASDVKLLLF
jgi:hypothetical protein